MSKKKKPAQPLKKAAKQPSSIIAVAGTIFLIIALIAILTYQPSNKSMPISQSKPSSTQAGAYDFVKQGALQFFSPKQDFLSAIDIEVAQDDSKRQLGLMYRDKLEDNQGMLFIFEGDDPRSFWMKNTVLPLDMIFVNSHNQIVTIHKNTTPYSEQSYTSTKPAQYVVEVNAGYTERHKISVGDHIAWSRE